VNPRLLSPNGAEYPSRLRELPEPPDPLYVVGEIPRGVCVAVVGTRHPTPEAREFTKVFAYDLATEGIVVVSGGADGIDTAAHEGALAANASTLVVAPAAFGSPYPEKNRALFERIVRCGGGYITSYPPGTIAMRHQFFARNAQLAALSDLLVIVESGLQGGARNAAKAARSLSRPVYAVPGSPWTAESLGCLEEIRLGASWVTSAKDVLVALGLSRLPWGPAVGPAPPFLNPESSARPIPHLPQSCSGDPDQIALLECLVSGPKTPDELCSLMRVSAGRLQALLLTLTLERIVVCDPAGQIRLGRH
jgi:DNA processing protein